MQHFIVAVIVVAVCCYIGRSLFRSYRSGKCSCSGGCASDCGEASRPMCLSQAEHKGETRE
ncbi:MAG: FeoB-associated Cys-rich membrane protein [Candidatus Electrothrix sp. MAN1_4]|nr:FeoB-associated Cys-rich membrane protein [Candidatus Electrothrix sp. MAN1_4]